MDVKYPSFLFPSSFLISLWELKEVWGNRREFSWHGSFFILSRFCKTVVLNTLPSVAHLCWGTSLMVCPHCISHVVWTVNVIICQNGEMTRKQFFWHDSWKWCAAGIMYGDRSRIPGSLQNIKYYFIFKIHFIQWWHCHHSRTSETGRASLSRQKSIKPCTQCLHSGHISTVIMTLIVFDGLKHENPLKFRAGESLSS